MYLRIAEPIELWDGTGGDPAADLAAQPDWSLYEVGELSPVAIVAALAAPATVRVVSNNTSAVYGKPFDLVFDASNFSVPQTVTLTSLAEFTLGPEDIFLLSEFPSSTITITPARSVQDRE